VPLPANLTVRTVTGRFVDSTGNPISGKITFSSNQILTDPGENVFVVPRPIAQNLDSNGAFTVELLATDDPDAQPVDWVWTVTEGWEGGRPPWSFVLPESSSDPIDLTDIAEVVEPPPVSQVLTVSMLGVTVARQSDLTTVAEDVVEAQADATTALANAAAAQSTANDALAAANGPHPEQGSVQFTADDTITPAVTARGVGGMTSPVLQAVDNTGDFRMLGVYFDRIDANVPINVPYFTVSQGFEIDGAGRRFYWTQADPGDVPTGTVWADGEKGVLKRRGAAGWEIRGQRAWDVTQYGAVGDGVTDDAAAINAVITAASAGDTVWFPGSKVFAIGSTLTVGKRLTFAGDATIKMTATNTIGFAVSQAASGSSWFDLKLEGPGALNNSSCRAISATGTSTAARVERLTFERLHITGWNRGIDGKWVHRWRIEDCDVDTIYYAGIHLFSASKCLIEGNDVAIPNVGQVAPVYGITLSRAQVDTMAVSPWSTDCTVRGNHIDGPSMWEGIDTHAGIRIVIEGNTVRNAMIPIAVVSGPGDGTDVHAPLMCSIVGNLVECTGLANSRNGIQLVGDQTNAVYMATGVIADNIIVDVGSEFLTAGAQPGVTGAGGIFLRSVNGATITGNTIIRPVAYGINLFERCNRVAIGNNTVVDPYSDHASHTYACHTVFRGTPDASGSFAGNVLANTGAVVSLFVATRGLVVGSGAGSKVEVGANDLAVVASAANRINDGTGTRAVTSIEGKQVQVGQSGGSLGFFGTAPTAKATVGGTSAAAGTAVRNLIVELAAKGIITQGTLS
jgi:hypothetical protein